MTKKAQETTPRKLTAKQRRFIQEYLIDLNATQAAIRAGYSERTATEIGCENLSKPNIAEAVQIAMKARAKQSEIDAAWVLKRLAMEADADLADLYNDAGGLKPIKEWPKIWRQGLVAGIESKQEFDYVNGEKVPDGIVQRLKLSDRIRRLELIGKHIAVGAFAEKHEHTGKDGGPIQVESTDLETARWMAFMLDKGRREMEETEH